jgi:hypothetical protein
MDMSLGERTRDHQHFLSSHMTTSPRRNSFMDNAYQPSTPIRRPDLKRKLVVVGDGEHATQYSHLTSPHLNSGGCGKTCLLIVYAENRFPEVGVFFITQSPPKIRRNVLRDANLRWGRFVRHTYQPYSKTTSRLCTTTGKISRSHCGILRGRKSMIG